MNVETNAFLKRHRLGISIFFVALLVRLFFIISAPIDKIETFGIGADGSDYVNEARNIVEGRGFSRDKEAPFLPDMIRTPIYPLVLAIGYLIFKSFYPILFFKAILSSFIPIIGMALVRLFSNKKSSLVITGLALAIEPHIIFYTTSYTSETIFVPLFCLFIFLFGRWIKLQKNFDLVFSSIVLGLATLTRPISILIPILCIGFMFFFFKPNEKKKFFVNSVIFTVIFFSVLSPWMIRNYIQFKTASISTVGWFNVYTRFATDITATKDKTDFYTAYHKNLDALSEKGYIKHAPPVSELEIQEAGFMPTLKKESLAIMRENPKEFIKVSLLATLAVLTQDNTLNILETNWNLQTNRPPFSPTSYFAQNGTIETVKYLVPYIKGTYIIPYFGRTLWLIIFIISIYGLYIATKHRPENRPMAIFLFSVIIYFIVFTINASPQIDGRYRTQFFICEIALCIIAYEYLLKYLPTKKK